MYQSTESRLRDNDQMESSRPPPSCEPGKVPGVPSPHRKFEATAVRLVGQRTAVPLGEWPGTHASLHHQWP